MEIRKIDWLIFFFFKFFMSNVFFIKKRKVFLSTHVIYTRDTKGVEETLMIQQEHPQTTKSITARGTLC